MFSNLNGQGLACLFLGSVALAGCTDADPVAPPPAPVTVSDSGAEARPGRDSGAPTPSPADASDASDAGPGVDIAGRWKSDCLGPQNDNYFRLSFDIATSDWKLDYDVFGDAKCTAGLVTVHIEGPYRIEAPSALVGGASDGVFSFEKRSITPHAQGFADFLNGPTGCGRGTFAVETPTSVHDAGCAPLGLYPSAACAADYDIVRRDGAELRLGQRPADNDMCTKAKRPVTLSTVILRRP